MVIDRERLVALAYGMLGSRASAEDIVQEAWLRLHGASGVDHPEAWMRTVVSRLALDELRSARARRETYVGPWLPDFLSTTEAEDPVEHQEALSLATMTVLERLAPAERCAFLLREMFDLDYAEIGALLAKSVPATRQLVSRSRKRIAAERPRYEPASEAHQTLLAALSLAAATGNLEALENLLVEDVRFVSDGGGKATAALRPVEGRTKVARLLAGLARRFAAGQTLRPAVLNGHAGALFFEGDVLVAALACCIDAGAVTALYSLRNPDKLRRLT